MKTLVLKTVNSCNFYLKILHNLRFVFIHFSSIFAQFALYQFLKNCALSIFEKVAQFVLPFLPIKNFGCAICA